MERTLCIQAVLRFAQFICGEKYETLHRQRKSRDTIGKGAIAVEIAAGCEVACQWRGALPHLATALGVAIVLLRELLAVHDPQTLRQKEQEKQRVFGVIPNFYVTYVPDAVPLTSKQKFGLAWKTTIDPVNFAVVGVIAGVQQAQNNFKDYGQGAQGYGKRYGASYADFVSDTFIGGALFPSLLKQDPRYFYKGTGTTRSRVLYALANAVICKGDNGHWQFNYSSVAGSLAAGGISNLYYPANDRGAALVFENTLIGIGENAATNLLQEFVIRKLTSNLPGNNTSNQQSKP